MSVQLFVQARDCITQRTGGDKKVALYVEVITMERGFKDTKSWFIESKVSRRQIVIRGDEKRFLGNWIN